MQATQNQFLFRFPVPVPCSSVPGLMTSRKPRWCFCRHRCTLLLSCPYKNASLGHGVLDKLRSGPRRLSGRNRRSPVQWTFGSDSGSHTSFLHNFSWEREDHGHRRRTCRCIYKHCMWAGWSLCLRIIFGDRRAGHAGSKIWIVLVALLSTDGICDNINKIRLYSLQAGFCLDWNNFLAGQYYTSEAFCVIIS